MHFGSHLIDHKQPLFCLASRAYNKKKGERKEEKMSETSTVKWLSYTLNRPSSNGQQAGQAQSIPNLFFNNAVTWWNY